MISNNYEKKVSRWSFLLFCLCFLSLLEHRIFGFNPNTYTIDESEEKIVFIVSLVSGVLLRNVEIEFFTEDGSAEGT